MAEPKKKLVISGRMDIGDIWSYVKEAITGKVRIDPSSYSRLTYGYEGGSSDNWDEAAAALDLLNIHLGNPASTNLLRVKRFLGEKVADKRFMQKEFGSWIYLGLHFEPTVLQYALIRGKGEPQIEAGLRSWLRALGGYLAITGCWGPGKTLTEAVAGSGPGARLLVGNGPYSTRTDGVPHTVFAGKRSWHFDKDWSFTVHALIILSSLCFGYRSRRGDMWKSHNAFMEAVEGTFGPLDIFTAEERQKLMAATRNDVEALEWCRRDLIGDWLPAESVVVVRAAGGVGQVLHEAGKAPTATVYYSGWEASGTTYAAGACRGGRGGKSEQIEPGMAEIDLASRSGWCQRTAGPDRVKVAFPLPAGDLVAIIEMQHGAGSRGRYFRNGVEVGAPSLPPREEPPTAEAGKETFVQRLWRWIRRGRK